MLKAQAKIPKIYRPALEFRKLMGPLLRNLAKVDPYTEMLVDCLKTIKMRDPIPKFYKGPKNRDPFTEKGFPYKFFGTPSTK